MIAPSAMLAVWGDTAELLSPPGKENNLMTVLLILLLSVALVLCLVCLLMVIHFLRSGRLARQQALPRNRLLPIVRRFYSPTTAMPSRWIAIYSDNPQA